MVSRLTRRDVLAGAAALTALPLAGQALGEGAPRNAALSPPGTPLLFIDKYGLIVQRDGDGGDTAQREGFSHFGAWIREHVLKEPWDVKRELTFDQIIALLEDGKTGRFRRHPEPSQWWSDTKGFSRDQQVPLVAAMGVLGKREPLERMWNALDTCPHLGRIVFKCVQGTKDVAAWDHQNLFRRARGEAPGWAGDTQLIGNVWARLATAYSDPDDTGGDLNLMVDLLMAKLHSPSWMSDTALDQYRRNRPICSGCYLKAYHEAYPNDWKASEKTTQERIQKGIAKGWEPECPSVLGALRWYFRYETGGNPELAELYAPIIDWYLS